MYIYIYAYYIHSNISIVLLEFIFTLYSYSVGVVVNSVVNSVATANFTPHSSLIHSYFTHVSRGNTA